MHVSRRLVEPLLELADKWELEVSPDERKSQLLNSDQEAELRPLARVLYAAIFAEADGKLTYVASDKRYSLETLTQGVQTIFGAGVFGRLPPLTRFDFEQAALCIAFELPTAAAFHLMRGAEGVLRFFYESVQRQNRLPEPRMWKQMTEHLSKRSSPPPKVLMDSLDNVRFHFRNPTQHPDKVYDLDEAQDLLALTADVVSRMIRHLLDTKRLEPAG